MKAVYILALVAHFVALSPSAIAQGSRADYERADRLNDRTDNKVFRTSIKPQWLSSRSRFWYRNDLAENRREWIIVDAENGERRAAFDTKRIAEALSSA